MMWKTIRRPLESWYPTATLDPRIVALEYVLSIYDFRIA